MRIVFLDIDGVLNHRRLVGDDALDPAAIAHLNAILARGRAEVVVSSTWRLGASCAELASQLGRHGFVGDIVGATPVVPGSRTDEIAAWLAEQGGVESFVILDDQPIRGRLARRHVRTSIDRGLEARHVEEALAHLGRRRRWWRD